MDLIEIPILREKVEKWQAGGYVEQLSEQAWCCKPMRVAAKYNLVKDETKQRPVIDLSRHMNKCTLYTCQSREDGQPFGSGRAYSERQLHGVV